MPAKQVKIRRGTTTEHSVFVGEIGEITVDTTKNTVVVHDKTLQGGNPLAKENMTNVFNSVGIQQLEVADGSANDVLTTNGMGGLSFSPVDISSQLNLGGDLSGLASNAQIINNAVGIDELDVNGDGSNGQALITNGSGQLLFGNVSVAQNSIGVIELNLSDGLNGQVLTTDGNANLSFQTPVTNPVVGGDLSGLASNAQIVNDVVGIDELDVNDGIAGQILSTDGNGQLVFINNTNTMSGSSSFVEDIFQGDGTTTDFTVSVDIPSVTTVLVYIDGVSQPTSSYSAPTARTLRFQENGVNTPPLNGSSIRVVHLGIVDTGNSTVGGDISGTIANAQIIPDAVGVTELNVSDGNAGEVLSTNGSGVLSFIPNSASSVGTGAVLQTQIVSTTAVTTRTSGGDVYSAITGLQGSITPTATTSRIFLSGNVMLSISSRTVVVRIMRSINGGSFVEVGSGVQVGNRSTAHSGMQGDAGSSGPQSTGIHFVDTPSFSLGQSIVYRLEAKDHAAAGVWRCNASQSDSDSASNSTRTISGFTMQELS